MRTKRRPFQGNVINLRSAHIRFTQRTTGTRTGLVGAGLCSARRRALVLTGILGGYECSFLLVCTGRCLLDPFGSSEFAEEFRKNRCILRADRVVRPYRIRGIEVSVQGPATLSAHLADTNLPQSSVKTGAFCPPYSRMRTCIRIRRGFPKIQGILPGGAEPRPYQLRLNFAGFRG